VKFEPVEFHGSQHTATRTGGNRIVGEGRAECAGPTPSLLKGTGRPSRNQPLAGYVALAD